MGPRARDAGTLCRPSLTPLPGCCLRRSRETFRPSLISLRPHPGTGEYLAKSEERLGVLNRITLKKWELWQFMISQELREGFQNREFSLRGGSTPFPTYPFYNVKHEHIDKKSTINAPPGGGVVCEKIPHFLLNFSNLSLNGQLLNSPVFFYSISLFFHP